MVIQIARQFISRFSKLEKSCSDGKGGADWIHIDVMDAISCTITFGPPVIKAIRPVTKVPFDVHLMVDNPMEYIDDYIKAGQTAYTVRQRSCLICNAQ